MITVPSWQQSHLREPLSLPSLGDWLIGFLPVLGVPHQALHAACIAGCVHDLDNAWGLPSSASNLCVVLPFLLPVHGLIFLAQVVRRQAAVLFVWSACPFLPCTTVVMIMQYTV